MVGVVFYHPLGSVQTSHFTDITDARSVGVNEVLGSVNHRLQSLSVLSRARTSLFVTQPMIMMSSLYLIIECTQPWVGSSVEHQLSGCVTANSNCLGFACEDVQYLVAGCGFKPTLLNFTYMGETALNTDLKSTNSTLMKLSLLIRCVKTEWRAVDMASFLDLFVLNAFS